MVGLNLGGYTATAAQPPSAAGATTIAQTAYGTGSSPSGGANGPTTARNGTLVLGLAGAAVLVFLWYSLPR